MGFMEKVVQVVVERVLDNPRLKGRLGLLAYSGFLCVWTTLALPTTPIEIVAGFSFKNNVVGSSVASTAGKTTGAVIAFIIGRWLMAPLSRLRGKAPGPGGGSALVVSGGFVGRFGELIKRLEQAIVLRPVQTIGMIRAAPIPGARPSATQSRVRSPTPPYLPPCSLIPPPQAARVRTAAVKNFGLSLLPSSVVPLSTFALATFLMNIPFSVAWSLAGKSAGTLQDAMSGGGEGGKKQKELMMQVTALVFLLAGMRALTKHFKVGELISGAGAAADAAGQQPNAPESHQTCSAAINQSVSPPSSSSNGVRHRAQKSRVRDTKSPIRRAAPSAAPSAARSPGTPSRARSAKKSPSRR